MFQTLIINSVGSDYGDIMREWEMVHADMRSTEFLITFLQNGEEEIERREQGGHNLLTRRYTPGEWRKMSNDEKKKNNKMQNLQHKGSLH